MDDNRKRYVKPEAKIIDLANNDIITDSTWADGGNDNRESWDEE